MKDIKILFYVLFLLACQTILNAQDKDFLMRSIDNLQITPSDISTATAHYQAIFGKGDEDSLITKGVARFGLLTVEPGGMSELVSYKAEEQVYFVLEGTGFLHYGTQKVPISKNDYMYLPVDVKHGLSNPREKELRVIVMGYKIPSGTEIIPIETLHLACMDDIPLMTLPWHPASTQYKLMMGTTESIRDKIRAASQINSMFLMDFSVGGTNNPHRHPREEEIYLVLRGSGDMVAGGTKENENRIKAKEGDVFFFSRNTLIGFYTGTVEGEPHARILAVRTKYPPQLLEEVLGK